MVHFGQGVFEGMGERAVTNIVLKNRNTSPFSLFWGDFCAFVAEGFYGLLHEMQGAQGMVKSCMQSPGIYVGSQAELPDSTQSLEVGMVYQIQQNTVGHGHKAVNGVVEDFFTGDHLNAVLIYFL